MAVQYESIMFIVLSTFHNLLKALSSFISARYEKLDMKTLAR